MKNPMAMDFKLNFIYLIKSKMEINGICIISTCRDPVNNATKNDKIIVQQNKIWGREDFLFLTNSPNINKMNVI
ncbi:MAG: hypothetical protein RR061_09130 [Muribaculaceae bacterium]